MLDCNSDSDLRRLPVASGGTGRCFHSCAHFFFSSHGCLKLTYSIPHSSWLQHKFLLRPPWILSAVTTWSCITWFVLIPPGFQHERWDAALCFPVMATRTQRGERPAVALCSYCSIVHAFYAQNTHIYIFFNKPYFYVPIRMCFFKIYILCMRHMCSFYVWPFYVHLKFALLSWAEPPMIYLYCSVEYQAFSPSLKWTTLK